MLSPPVRRRLLESIRALLLLLLLVSWTTAPQLQVPRRSGHCIPDLKPQAPDRSGHQTSTASARSQWALPNLNRQVPIAVGAAGPRRPAPDRSGTAGPRQIEGQNLCHADGMSECTEDRMPAMMPDELQAATVSGMQSILQHRDRTPGYL